jgi:hypothetical protein
MLSHPRRLGTSAVLGVALVTFAGLAVTAHGFPVQHVSLNDGAIWVTDNSLGTVGRFAKPIAQLDAQLAPASLSSDVDVWQDGPVVAAYDATGGRIYAVNVYGPGFYDAGTAISPAANGIALGDTTLAVLSTDHALRTAALSAGGGSVSALSATAKPLAAHLPANSAVAVGADDTVWVAGGGQLRGYPAGGGQTRVTALPLSASDPMQVTTVGAVPVVADAATQTLYLPDSGHQVTLPGADGTGGFELQQSSDASDVVVAATGQALYSVNLSTGELATLSSGHAGTAAAPVQVAGCVHAAWANGETGSYVRSCGAPPPATSAEQTFSIDDTQGTPSLVFRVNNGSVVLNDTTDGGVFLVDSTVTNVRPQWTPSNTAAQNAKQAQTYQVEEKTQLVAKPYTQGVRPGTTTVVHVLDVDKGPPGVTYAISAVGLPDQRGVTVSVAPDAQTVLATVTSLTTDAHFQYTIDDGHGHSASAEVTLVPVSPGQSSRPYLQPGYAQPPLSVAAGGTLIVPVIGYWRDFDGDPLYIDSGSVGASAGSAAVTSGGALALTAPQSAQDETVTVSYGVSDRGGPPTMASLKVSVLGSSSTRFVAPAAEPVSALAEVGAPITLQPLANNLPGVDPTNPNATLTLAAPVPAVPGATVTTDLAAGTVTFTAQHPGDFFLSYTDAYGAAPTSTGTIRVHVVPAGGPPKPPVTTPDVAVLHGQQPATVDVLADDYDPQGWILGVTTATSDDPGVRVTVVDQEWLRISADDPEPGMTATVDYTVSDGVGSATGTVAVSAMAAGQDADQISTVPAAITVMAGDSAAVPVLAGDASSTGLPLSLAGVPPTDAPPVAGLLASAQGADIRVVAPASVATEEETTVSYVATDASGATATGQLEVTIEPPPSKAHPDQAPVPEEVDTRETAGDVAVIRIPVDGVDPEGDSVTVTGVTVPPALGRIVAVGPDTISYQSYPDSAGTDTFTYQVTDPYGLTGTAQVRIAVLPPGPPQPPVAANDVIDAPPGATLHWNVLASDYVAPGDTATIEPLAATNKTVPAGVRLAGDYVYLRVPAAPSDPPVEFSYGVTDGSTPSLGQVVVHAVAGAKVPPIANDDVAPLPPAGAAAVTLNVLKNDDDPVGSPGDLRITWVPAGVVVHGPDLTIRLAAQPREVPYQVTAPDGLTATAVVYVPGTAASAIRLRPGARITLKQDGSATVPLGSMLVDTTGRQLKITTLNGLTASPAGDITVNANEATAFQVRALGRYAGPGAVSVQVYDGATLQDKHGYTETVTIPVQVGPDVPVLRCPQDALDVAEGGAPQSYNIGQLCHVWVDTTIAAAAPRYTLAWSRQPGGVDAAVTGGTVLELAGASNAAPGTTGTLRIIPSGATTGGTLNVEVIQTPLPVGSPVSVSANAGQSVTVDLSQFVTSPLAEPDIQVLGTTHPAGATVTSSGSTVTVTPGANTHGSVSLVATVTDVAGRSDRAIPVSVTVTVIGHPGAPGQPSATAANGSIALSFGAAAPNGAPVEHYTVYADGAPHQCQSTDCTVTGLANGTTYSVYVTATNSAGEGPRSGTITATPNAIPGQVAGLQVDQEPGQADKQLALSWQPAPDAGSPVTRYDVEISSQAGGQGGITSVGLTTSHTFSGLTNGTAYTFEVRAVNALGRGSWSLPVSATPFGPPPTMAAPTAVGASVPDPTATRAITVSWAPAEANGRPVTGYTVSEYQSTSDGGPWGSPVDTSTVSGGVTSTSFTVDNDSSWYEYTVSATNLAGPSVQSALSSPAVQAAAPPDPPANVSATATGQDNTIQVTFTAGAANSKQVSSIEYGINGAAASGTIAGPFTAGTNYTETITGAMNAGVVNGTPLTVYVAECNDAGLCSTWAGPSGQVVPYGPLANPTVTATANGTTINYTWGATSDGLTETLNVCIAGGCSAYTVPATGNYSGSSSATYGYSQQETVTAYVTDTAGQRAPQTGTVNASATTGPAPPPVVSASVSIGQGPATSQSGCESDCHWVAISVSNFPDNTKLEYTCKDNGVVFYGPADFAYPSGTTSTNGNGGGSPTTDCFWGYWSNAGHTLSITVTVGGTTATGSFTG